MFSKTLVSSLLFLSGASAHFLLQYPPSLGFDEDIESESPCGGFDVVFADNDTSVTVDSFPILAESTHPTAEWLFRVTNDTAAPYTWTNLQNVIEQDGLGEFCIPDFAAPSGFAGSKGLIQVIYNGDDGILYQCAAVNWVSGSNTSVASSCANATGVTATITSDTSLTDNATSTATSSSSTASATSSGNFGSPLDIPSSWMTFGVGLAAFLALA